MTHATTQPGPLSLDPDVVRTWFAALNEPAWLTRWRLACLERTRELPWPESRYTRLTGFHPEQFQLYPPTPTHRTTSRSPDTHIRITPRGIESITRSTDHTPCLNIRTFRELLKESNDLLESFYRDHRFQIPLEQGRPALLLHGMWTDGLWIEFNPGADRLNPLVLLDITHDRPNAGRVLPVVIRVAPHQRGTLVVHQHTAEPTPSGLDILGLDVTVEAGASLQVHQLNGRNEQTFGFHFFTTTLERDATLETTTGWFGDRLVMGRTTVRLAGTGANVQDTQVMFGHNKQHFDFHTFTHHLAPHTTSQVRVRGVLKDRARSVFYGLVRIDHGAKNSNAHLEDHVMILNPGAHADAIPALEIEENEVRCSHSASVGRIDEEKVFYAMSRGLDEDSARCLIVEGFLSPVIDSIRVDAIRERVVELLDQKWHQMKPTS